MKRILLIALLSPFIYSCTQNKKIEKIKKEHLVKEVIGFSIVSKTQNYLQKQEQMLCSMK